LLLHILFIPVIYHSNPVHETVRLEIKIRQRPYTFQ